MSMDVAKRFIDMILDPDPDTAEYIDSRNSIACIIEFIAQEMQMVKSSCMEIKLQIIFYNN